MSREQPKVNRSTVAVRFPGPSRGAVSSWASPRQSLMTRHSSRGWDRSRHPQPVRAAFPASSKSS